MREESPFRVGFWPWLLQRVSALLIIVILSVHLWNQHFGKFGNVDLPFQNQILLVLVTFHALNGGRMILLDFSFFSQRERALTYFLLTFGFLTVLWMML